MKVAIIGAGISGLACATKLKLNGITPTIFEARSRVGDGMCTTCLSLRIFTRSFHNYFHYMNKKYGLDIKPLYPINKIIMHSPGKTVSVHGKLGYSIMRGIDPFSMENQIASKFGGDILFDKYVEISQLVNVFDKIVVATGNNVIPDALGTWSETFMAISRYGTVLGEFDTGTVEVWLDTRHSKNSFCYMVPVSPKEASIVLVVNDISCREMDFYWKEFFDIEKIKYPVIEIKDAEHRCGTVSPYNLGIVYFTGNAAGLTDDFVGFGVFNAMESGLLAARAIVENLDYNKLILPISRNITAINKYRKAINLFENENYDHLLSLLNCPPIKHFIYNNPLFRVSQGHQIIKILSNTIQKGRS